MRNEQSYRAKTSDGEVRYFDAYSMKQVREDLINHFGYENSDILWIRKA